MKNHFFLFLLCYSSFLSAQISTSGYFLQQVGIEQNPLRQAISLDTTEGSLAEVRPLMGLSKVYVHLRSKKDGRHWGIMPRLSYQYFLGTPAANYLRLDGQQYFRWRLNKQWRLLQEADWRTRRRSGADEEEAFFSIPRTYRQRSFALGFEWDPNREWEITSMATIGRRRYELPEDRDGENFYNYTELRVDVERKYREGTLDNLQSWLAWQQRNWLLEDIGENEEVLRFRETKLHNVEIGTELEMQWNDRWSGGPILMSQFRFSERQVQNYFLGRVGFRAQWETEALVINLNTTFSYKHFPKLFPNAELEEPLQYGYNRSEIKLTKPLNQQGELSLTLGWQHRTARSEIPVGSNLGSYTRSYVHFGYKKRF